MSMAIRVGALASGGGSNVQAIIEASEAGRLEAEVVVVISDNEAAGALERARNHGIDGVHVEVPKTGTAQWERANSAIISCLREHAVDLVVLAGYMRIVSPKLLRAFPGAVMNIHPALLPSFPGTHGQRDANDYGVKLAGATVHFADEQFDTGPIIIQGTVPVLDGDTAESLGARILGVEHVNYPQAVQWFAAGRLRLEGRRVLLDGSPVETDARLIWPPPDL